MQIKIDDLDEVDGLVVLAKAAFYNLTLLRAFEAAAADGSRFRGHRRWTYDRRTRESIAKAHREGLFLQMRRQMPFLTDEALENRLNLILRQYCTTLRQSRARRGSSRAGSCHEGQNETGCNLDVLLTDLPALLEALAETFLCEAPDRSLRVRSRLIGPWQDLILVVPPLLISSAWIYQRAWQKLDAREGHGTSRQLVERMTLWLCDSTLPVDDDPALDQLCRQHGLDETHLHLMGTTEADKVWCDALSRPKVVVDALRKGLKGASESGLRLAIGSGVDRLLRQEDSQLTDALLLRRLNDAAKLKAMLLLPSGRHMGEAGAMRPSDFWARERRRNLGGLPKAMPLVVQEAWHLCSILAAFENDDTKAPPSYFIWQYALVRAQFCRLLVQQAGQSGFDQFQYITLNELRETTEKDFAERFRQIERGQQRGIDFVEGRFAPKSDPDKLVDLLGRILRGYLRFLGEDERSRPRDGRGLRYGSFADLVSLVWKRQGFDQTTPFGSEQFIDNGRTGHVRMLPSVRRLRLGLVVHFIKRYSLKEHAYMIGKASARPPCRHAKMRKESAEQARALTALLRQIPQLRKFIRGADAAGNERQAGPEVLAPTFRILRRTGMKRFTYHAGEDFAHIASGLRAMVEAIMFLDLDAGCRIGHGTAAGLLPEAWWEAMGGSAVLPVEDRLDDLVLARHLLLSNELQPQRLALIDAEISRLAMLIWIDPCVTPDLLTQAWSLRHLDPLAVRFTGKDPALHRRAEALLHAQARNDNAMAYRHYLRRHGIICTNSGFTPRQMRDEIARGAELMTVRRCSDVLDVETLRVLQSCVLKLLNRRRMAIETLPTSNVRISIHQGHEDHHALNWLGLGTGSLHTPVDVVIGSDDPGIFATSLRMEYAHLMRCLRDEPSRSGDRCDPLQLMERMCLNAKQFRF